MSRGEVLRICLVNMPFAGVRTPSLALTQLRSVLEDSSRERVSVEIHYLNNDFAKLLGLELYWTIAGSGEAYKGIGDWFFRRAAFPDLPDNSDEYFKRFYPHGDRASRTFRDSILRCREEGEELMSRLCTDRGLHQAHIVGFASIFSQNTACFAMARVIKERNPEVITVMGGANCETPMGEEIASHVKDIDFVFSGPALKSFPRFVRHLLDGEAGNCHAIKGVFSKKNCSKDDQRGTTGEPLDINAGIELDYDSYLDALADAFPDGEVMPRLLFETSRGCWWGERSQCIFCGLNGTSLTHHAMTPERAVDRIQHLFRYYPRCSYFECVDNLLPKGYVREVFPKLRTPADATIFYEVRANMTGEELEVLSGAGVKRVQAGIEALATSNLRLMRKGTTAFMNLVFLKNCVTHGIECIWYLLVGFPGELEEVYESYLRTIPLLTHLTPPTGVYNLRFDRNSPYFNQAGSYGLDLHPYHFYELVYPFSEEVLKNLAYYFMDVNFGADHYQIMVRWVDRLREQVDLWRKRWAEATVPPFLCFDGEDGTTVYDSRSGETLVYDIGDAGRQMLDHLNKPCSLDTLAAKLAHLPVFDEEKEMEALQQKGLVFQEGRLFLSLVLPGKAQVAACLEQPEACTAVPAGGDEGAVPELKHLKREDFRLRPDSVTGGKKRRK